MKGGTSQKAVQSGPTVEPVMLELSAAGTKEPDTSDVERIKHPLERAWTIWFYSHKSHKWEDNLVEITTFDTVEDFWCLFHHMKMPSELEHGQDYAVFQKGVTPMWEDSANRRGARLLLTIDKKNFEEVDRFWLDTILLMIGENFNDLNYLIRGVVINFRPKANKTKVGIWLADKNKQVENILIGKKLKEALDLPWRLPFYAHNSIAALYYA